MEHVASFPPPVGTEAAQQSAPDLTYLERCPSRNLTCLPLRDMTARSVSDVDESPQQPWKFTTIADRKEKQHQAQLTGGSTQKDLPVDSTNSTLSVVVGRSGGGCGCGCVGLEVGARKVREPTANGNRARTVPGNPTYDVMVKVIVKEECSS